MESTCNAAETERRDMASLVELLREGGQGYLDNCKRSGWIRILFENFNSIGIGTQDWKVSRLNYLIKCHGVDVLCGCETNVDWRQVGSRDQFLDVIAPGYGKSGEVVHNVTSDLLRRNQRGGTVTTALGRLCDKVQARNGNGRDETGLGRFCWIQVGGEDDPAATIIMTAYFPSHPPSSSKGETVWDQHKCYFEAKGDFRDPVNIMLGDILRLIRAWRLEGKQVILAADLNDDVYSGRMASAIADSPFNMQCLLHKSTGGTIPNSHFRGTRPICSIFGSSGLTVGDGMCFPHWYGIGDHRVLIVEVSAESLFGGSFPKIGLAKNRALNCKISRCRKEYNHVLKSLADRHNMYGKLLKIKQLTQEECSAAQYQLQHNKWDNELGDFMASAEDQCLKFKSSAIEYSPTVGQWIKRRSILKWILRWYDGKVRDSRNLLRAAERNNVSNPLSTSREDIEARLSACIAELIQLKKVAPELRRKHLLSCLLKAKERRDEEAVQEILRIRRKECNKKRQQNINKVVKKAHGRAVMAIQVDEDGVATMHENHDDIVRVVNSRIGSRYRLGARSTVLAGQIARDLGHLADTEAAKMILDGTYVFPPDTDPALIELLQEAAAIRMEFDDCPVTPNPVTVEDFIEFWHGARENTASSDSGRHFSHYIAASDDPELATLHVESLNIASEWGLPLDRWKSGLTVLLEKILGNIFVDKLRAICLLEADFNWWLKVIFARRMMQRIRDHNMIPVEQIATSGKNTTDGTMLKQMGFYDRANTLHVTSALDSVDAEQCYDAANHTVTSIGLQAHVVPAEHIRLYLGCMALMCFHLKTGYKRDEVGFSGSLGNYFHGLGQGSGGAPSAWQVISALMIGVYRRHGYGVRFNTAWSGMIFTIAAILYVDDCDLIHMCCDHDMTEMEFLERKQRAMYFWGLLLQATGGMLKQKKCFWYLLSYKFVRGEAKLRRLRELPQYEMVVPQHSGIDAVIEFVDVTDARETLGVFTSPESTPKPKSVRERRSKQLQKMIGKGEEWCRRVSGSQLSTRDIWFSLMQQAKPSYSFGLVPLMDNPSVVEESFQALYFKCLPALGVNRNITKGWRILPQRFQGLGLPNMALEKLSESLSWLQRHWGVKEGVGLVVREAYERLQVETGLSGNVFIRDFKKYECLATHTWYKIFWEYLDAYEARLEFDSTLNIPPVRERDKALMDIVVTQLPREMWKSVNRVRKHKRVFFLSQVVHCDGICVQKAMLTKDKGRDSTMIFPLEQPTNDDFRAWKDALKSISSSNLRVSPPLGKFLRDPYEAEHWLTNDDRSVLVQSKDNGSTIRLFKPQTAQRLTRQACTYTRCDGPIPPLADLTHRASIISSKEDQPCIHSVSKILTQTMEQEAVTIESMLLSLPNASLWRTLDLDGDGSWVVDALARGTLIIVHDGSYMEHLDRSSCSAGGVIFCTQVRRMGFFSATERTDPETASNYRGELLGGFMASLILWAANEILRGNSRPPLVACDNMGVVIHANNCRRSLKEAQTQADLIRCLRSVLSTLRHSRFYQHVYGHQDSANSWSSLTLLQQLNVIADKIAKDSLICCVRSGNFISSTFPFESFKIVVGGKKVTSSIKKALYNSWGYSEAKQLFHERGITTYEGFDLIYWEGYSAAMEAYPQMFKVWITKLVSHFNGCNRQLSKWDESVENVCPCCGQINESTSHITRCEEEGRTKLFFESVDLLTTFLHNSHMDTRLVECFEEYFEGRGTRTMTAISSYQRNFKTVARDIDLLGWDCLLQGRIPSSLVDLQDSYLSRSESYWRIKTWSSHFIQHLLNITHRQWLYRNARIHLRKLDSMTTAEHETVIELVKDMMLVDPVELLPQHRQLLERDFVSLGEGSGIDRKLWLQQMGSALSAARRQSSESDDSSTSWDRIHGNASALALRKYKEYREQAGIATIKRSNMAKRVRLT